MKNMNELLKQAQQMQLKVSALQNELSQRELDVTCGGGAVKIKINGKQNILDFKLDKDCIDIDDIAGLESLIKLAMNQAISESQNMVSSAMNKVTGGVKIPGIF